MPRRRAGLEMADGEKGGERRWRGAGANSVLLWYVAGLVQRKSSDASARGRDLALFSPHPSRFDGTLSGRAVS